MSVSDLPCKCCSPAPNDLLELWQGFRGRSIQKYYFSLEWTNDWTKHKRVWVFFYKELINTARSVEISALVSYSALQKAGWNLPNTALDEITTALFYFLSQQIQWWIVWKRQVSQIVGWERPVALAKSEEVSLEKSEVWLDFIFSSYTYYLILPPGMCLLRGNSFRTLAANLKPPGSGSASV